MQGSKNYQESLFLNYRLSERIPANNFYRCLKENLDLSFIRDKTRKYYGLEGHKSIDPVVFFKLMLVGCLDNITSDRKIIEQCSLRLDVLYFLDYNIDEALPWHSTLSRTRQLFGEEVFLELFRDILKRCVSAGLVDGKIQAVDSAFIKANASFNSIVERKVSFRSKKYFDELSRNEEFIQPKKKYNERFCSSTDSDARMSQKRGKSPAFNHLGIISVDTQSHIICGAKVDFADNKDCETTEKIVKHTIENLKENNIKIEEVLADTGYSNGQTYQYLQSQNITAYIPPIAQYKPQKEGFTYDEKEDCYICSQGVKLHYCGIKLHSDKKASGKSYRAKSCDCKNCPLKNDCCKNDVSKILEHTSSKPFYDEAYKRINSNIGKSRIRLRTSTVEPVWGTLLNFRRMRKMYTIGNASANKQLLMASATHNLKKLINHIIKKNRDDKQNMQMKVKVFKNILFKLKTLIFTRFFDIPYIFSLKLSQNYLNL